MQRGTVEEIPSRDYLRVKFTGELRNKDGFLDIGGHYKDYEAEVLRRAKVAKVAGILGKLNISSMPRDVKNGLEERLRLLEAILPINWSSAQMRSMTSIRKDLLDESIQQEKRNTQADTVISIRHEISARNVQIFMEQVAKPFGVNSQEALGEIIKRQEELLFSEAYLRLRQAQEKVYRVGIAFTPSQLMMLVGILGDVYDHVEDWLVKSTPDGNKEWYDKMTPPISEPEKLRSLMERMSMTAQSIGAYRLIVSNGLSAGSSFQEVVEEIRSILRTDIPSLDHASPNEPQMALVAKVEDTVQQSRVDDRMMAFQAGFQMAHDKRQRTDDVRPYASAPQTMGSQYNVSCNYWDGDKCDYEEITKKPCRFSDGHSLGKSTFVRPYVAKPVVDMGEYQEWKRMKDSSARLSQT